MTPTPDVRRDAKPGACKDEGGLVNETTRACSCCAINDTKRPKLQGKARCDSNSVTNFTSNLVTSWMNHGSSSFSSPNSSQHARMRSQSNILPRISEPQYSALDDIGGRHRLMRYPWKKVAIGAGIFFTLLWLLSSSSSTLGTPGPCNLSLYDSIHEALTELC